MFSCLHGLMTFIDIRAILTLIIMDSCRSLLILTLTGIDTLTPGAVPGMQGRIGEGIMIHIYSMHT